MEKKGKNISITRNTTSNILPNQKPRNYMTPQQPQEIQFPSNLYVYNDDEPIIEQQLPTQIDQGKEQLSQEEVENSIHLSLRLKRKIVQSSSFNNQTFPMLVSLAVDNLKTSSKAPIDLVCVIDQSGSMNGEKIELVQNTFNYLLNYLGDSDRISIVVFNLGAKKILSLTRTTTEGKEKILKTVKGIVASGGTNINAGLVEAFKILKYRKHQNPVSSIFLLSDGLDSSALASVPKSLVSYNVPDDITINTFGFGKDHDPQLMNDIADQRDGNFYFIEKLDTIDEAFVDCLGGLLSSIGQNVIIKIRPEQSEALEGVEILKAYGDQARWAREGQIFITKLSSLITGTKKDFLLELSLPKSTKELQDHEKNIKVASAEVDVTTLGGKTIVKKADLRITLLNETEECKEEEEDDREVMKNFYRIKGASIIEEARKKADNREYEEAKKLLNGFKEELENSYLKEEEFIQNLLKDIVETINNVHPEVYNVMGRHNMIENTRAQMNQKSNLKSNICYQNKVQTEMITAVRAMKSKK